MTINTYVMHAAQLSTLKVIQGIEMTSSSKRPRYYRYYLSDSED